MSLGGFLGCLPLCVQYCETGVFMFHTRCSQEKPIYWWIFNLIKTKAADRLLESLPQRQKGMCMHACFKTLFYFFSHYYSRCIYCIDVEQRIQLLSAAKNNIIYLPKESKKKAYDKKHSCPEVFQVGAFVMKKDFTRKKRI